MLNGIELQNYRGFTGYTIADLSRVNLLVGRNNSGKTSLLEAVYLLASGGSPAVMVDIAERRGELLLNEGIERYAAPRRSPVISHFFHGHDMRPGAQFSLLATGGTNGVAARIAIMDATELSQQPMLDYGEPPAPTMVLRIDGPKSQFTTSPTLVPVSDEGAVSNDVIRRLVRGSRLEAEGLTPVTFVSPDSLGQDSMSGMWDRVIMQSREAEVVDALRILEPDLTSIHFLSGPYPRYLGYVTPAGVLIGLEGRKQRVPLGSYGDGMRRLLTLSIALIRAAGGYLLLDEIDTGLHYSVMGDLWRLVTHSAIQSDVQVCATTHSLDCIAGLLWLAKNHPDLYEQVTVHKIEPTLSRCVSLQGTELTTALEQEMEIR